MTPSSDTQIAPGTLWIVSAPSGCGKTTLTRALVPRMQALGWPAEISVSYTTRAPRSGEVEGVHYHFIDADRFARMAAEDAFLEHATVFGRSYGTGLARTDTLLAAGTDVILDIDWQGARQIRARRPDVCSLFILPPSSAELERRLRGRGTDSEETIASRMLAARSEMSHYDEYDYVVVNEDFDRALNEIVAVFTARRLRVSAQSRTRQALISSLLE